MSVQGGRSWYVSRAGQLIGPMSDVELAWIARERILRADDAIWSAGLARWMIVKDVPGLLPTTSPMTPARTQSAPPLEHVRSAPLQSPARSGQETIEELFQKHLKTNGAPAQPARPTQIGPLRSPAEPVSGPPMAPRPSPLPAVHAPTPVAAFRSPQTSAPPPTLPSSRTASAVAAHPGAPQWRVAVATAIVDNIGKVLGDMGVDTWDDLVDDMRLRNLAELLHGQLPFVLRLALNQFWGTEACIAWLFGNLVQVRSRVLAGRFDGMLRMPVRDNLDVLYVYLVSAPLPVQIDDRMQKALGDMQSGLQTGWSGLVGGIGSYGATFSALWGQGGAPRPVHLPAPG
ncbi:MAG: GYF domain-containing protein [Hyphomicrobium sp.]|nr:GYF domain-containing protein [Hyphomicrobium sp.]